MHHLTDDQLIRVSNKLFNTTYTIQELSDRVLEVVTAGMDHFLEEASNPDRWCSDFLDRYKIKVLPVRLDKQRGKQKKGTPTSDIVRGCNPTTLVWPYFLERATTRYQCQPLTASGLPLERECDFEHPYMAATGDYKGIQPPASEQAETSVVRILLLFKVFPATSNTRASRNWNEWLEELFADIMP